MEIPYQISAAGEPVFFGRNRELFRIMDVIGAEEPGNLMVVGPRYTGKTVLLKNAVSQVSSEHDRYVGAVYWSLATNTPKDDRQFLSDLCEVIRDKLIEVNHDSKSYFGNDNLPPDRKDEDSEANLLDLLRTVLDTLHEEGQRILVVMDHFDAAMVQSSITRNLWDNLNGILDNNPALVFITGSQRKLKNLCKDKDTGLSNFWLLFDNDPLRPPPFTIDDRDSIVRPLEDKGFKIEGKFMEAAIDASGGNPVILCDILGRVYRDPPGDVTADTIRKKVEEIGSGDSNYLEVIWDDLKAREKQTLNDLLEADGMLSDFHRPDCRRLQQWGLIRKKDNRLSVSCGIFKEFFKYYGEGITAIERLFGNATGDDYVRHMRDILELRLEKINRFDESVFEEVSGLLEKIKKPKMMLPGVRPLIKDFIDLIMDKICPDRRIQDEWQEKWDSNRHFKRHKHFKRILDDDNKIGTQSYHKSNLLLLITGVQYIPAVTPEISKDTAVIINMLIEVGRSGNHTDEYDFGSLYCVSVCTLFVNLCENLAGEL